MSQAAFQTFDDSNQRAAVAGRVAALRAALKRLGLDGFVVPRADRWQNEYVAPCDERLAWLTGFTGSAGFAIVTQDKAALFVDGRYTTQVRDQTDTGVFSIEHLVDAPPQRWLEGNLGDGATIGYDPWLHTAEQADTLAKACENAGASLKALPANPIDSLWKDRPAPPAAPVVLHDLAFAGEASADKVKRVQAEIAKARADALVVTDPQSVMWLFNIRGGDLPHVPLALSDALVPREGRPALYVDGRKLDNAVRAALENLADVRAPADLGRDLATLNGKIALLDRASAAQALNGLLSDAGAKAVRDTDPITAMKAVKNKAEIEGSRAAHRRDGAAMVRFLAWLDREAPSGKLTEIGAVERLEAFRRETGKLKDVSFPTISGSGPNGAIVHYRVTRATDRRISPGELFLIDSGAQYQDGTTDITRTVAVGPPTDEMRDRFTRVLKGHIAIATAIFPENTSGAQLDPFARAALWEAGLDYDHGTGHGVGSYLSVHEGPARISKMGTAPLRRGMILSNEPGYYKPGAYGIRIENLVLVIAEPQPAGADKPLNAFETLTLAPIDRRLVEVPMLTAKERNWLDAYHERVRDTISPLVDGDDAKWLKAATAPL